MIDVLPQNVRIGEDSTALIGNIDFRGIDLVLIQ